MSSPANESMHGGSHGSYWYQAAGGQTLRQQQMMTEFDESVLQILELLPIEQRKPFARLFKKYCDSKGSQLDWNKVHKPPAKMMIDFGDIEKVPQVRRDTDGGKSPCIAYSD